MDLTVKQLQLRALAVHVLNVPVGLGLAPSNRESLQPQLQRLCKDMSRQVSQHTAGLLPCSLSGARCLLVPGSPNAACSDAALSSVLPGSVPEAFLTKVGRTLVCSTCVSPTSNASASHAEHNVLSEEFEFSLACSGGNAAVPD